MSAFARQLLAWYASQGRRLPWRELSSPYRSLVSELMLQQTQVDTVLPYFERFMVRFPSLEALAAASQEEVLALWEGLGYYSRARNLHRTAQILVNEHDGQMPATKAALEKLPGLGSYTAAAIASIAFGQPEPALDGNLRRVLARLRANSLPIGTSASDALLLAAARELMPTDAPGDFNQALMDLGALICLPKNPVCPSCPVQSHCQSFAQGLQNQIPVRKKRPAQPLLEVGAAIIRQGPLVLICRRPQKGLLAGLWEFPGGKLEPDDADMPACIRREILEELGLRVQVLQFFGSYRHSYTHFKLRLEAWVCAMEAGQSLSADAHRLWLKPAQLAEYPMGKVDRQIARELMAGKNLSGQNKAP